MLKGLAEVDDSSVAGVWCGSDFERADRSPLLPPQHGVARAQRLLLNSRHHRDSDATASVRISPEVSANDTAAVIFSTHREKLSFYLKNGERLSS